MPKIKFDVSSSDPKDAFKGGAEPPKPGVYTVKIVQCKPGAKQGEPDSKRLEIVVEVVNDKKYKGARLYDYIAFNEASAWKMDQFLQVLGVTSASKRRGTWDTDDAVGEQVKVRVTADTYNGEYRARLAAYLPGEDSGDDDDEDFDAEADDEELEDDELEDDEDESDEDDESEDDEEELDEDDEDEDVPPYDEWDINDLKAEAKARKIRVKPGSKKSTYVKLLEADDGAGEEDEDDDDEDEEDPF